MVVRRILDVLVIGALGLVAWSVGGQLTAWWRAEPEVWLPQTESLTTEWAVGPVSLTFGERSAQIERFSTAGTPDDVRSALATRGEELLQTSQWPDRPVSPAERAWLASLKTAPARAIDSAAGNVYTPEGQFPSLIVTRFLTATNQRFDDGLTERIVGWGMTFPTGQNQWLVYLFQPTPQTSRTKAAVAWTAPPAAKLLLSQSDARGHHLTAYEGDGTLEEWSRHFDTCLGKPEEIIRAESPRTLVRRYDQGQLTGPIDVHLALQPNGRISGLVWQEHRKVSPETKDR